jgi:hypothetical protein
MYRSIGYLSVTLAKWNRDCALLQAAALAQLHLHNAGMRQPMRTDGEEGKRIFFFFSSCSAAREDFYFRKGTCTYAEALQLSVGDRCRCRAKDPLFSRNVPCSGIAGMSNGNYHLVYVKLSTCEVVQGQVYMSG